MLDFSLHEFDQLQAEQEVIWNPQPNMADLQAPTRAAVPGQALGPAVKRNMATSGNYTQLRHESFWERDLAAMRHSSAHAIPAPASGPSQQDGLLPTQRSADYAAEGIDNNALELEQRQRAGSSDSTERSKAVNRESQRRFRLRQKVQRCLLHLMLHCRQEHA